MLGVATPQIMDAVPRSPYGSLWKLGRHTLMCGDATSTDDVAKLLDWEDGPGGVKVDCLLTDPPYGADLLEKWASCKRMHKDKHDYNARPDDCANDSTLIRNDVDDYRLFYATALRRVPWAPVNTAYIFMSTANLHLLRLACDDADIHHSDYLIWRKQSFVVGRRDYHSQYETIFYGWSGKHAFYGKPHQANVLDHKRNRKNSWHPCQKPLDLVCRLIRNGTPPGYPNLTTQTAYLQRNAKPLPDGEAAVVYDPFAGGGTTLLAAEYTGRTCYAMELDPARCDAIRERWEQRNEEFAKLEGYQDGHTA